MTPADERHSEHTGPSNEFDESLARAALEVADLNALRLCLYMCTGDPALAAMKVGKEPVRRGAQFRYVLECEQDRHRVKDMACEYLREHFGEPEPPAPDFERACELMRIYAGGDEISPEELRFGYEELAFDAFPRDVTWTGGQPADAVTDYNVVIIGAGISGLAVAVQLQRLGVPYTVIDRQDGIGGTWQLNNYPDARVDTSSYIYQYKFEKRHRWSEYFASRGETLAYLEEIADKYGVRPNVRLGVEVVEAVWNEGAQAWDLTLSDGADGGREHLRTRIVVSASGLFSTPNLPDIPGIENFTGRIFHTTAWDWSHDYTGQRVAVIGTGSTGTQLLASVAEKAGNVTVFQRNPQWVSKIPNYREKVSAEVGYLLDVMPFYWNWLCYGIHVSYQQLQWLQEYDPEWMAKGGQISERNDRFRESLIALIDEEIGDDPALRAKLLPDYAPLTRRLVTDNGWFRALTQDHVELVTEPIERFTNTSIVTLDGAEREFDLVIVAAGFKVSKYFFPIEYVGRHGITLEQSWAKDGARAYLGMTMPGYPNLFTLFGPNGQPRSGSFYSWAEVWARYICEVIVHMIETGATSVEVLQDVNDAYNERMDEEMQRLLWLGKGSSYYVNEFARVGVQMPWLTHLYHSWTIDPNLADFWFTHGPLE